MIDSKNLLSDAELDKVAGGMTEKEATGVVNGCLNSKDGSFVFGGLKYTLNLNGQTLDGDWMKWMISEVLDAERYCAGGAKGADYKDSVPGPAGKQLVFTAVKL